MTAPTLDVAGSVRNRRCDPLEMAMADPTSDASRTMDMSTLPTTTRGARLR
jgi:hypothetical protein